MMIKMEKNMDLKNKYDSIIFDLDGTLWNSSKPICEAWNIILDRHKEIVREPITIEELEMCIRDSIYIDYEKSYKDMNERYKTRQFNAYRYIGKEFDKVLTVIDGKFRYNEYGCLLYTSRCV